MGCQQHRGVTPVSCLSRSAVSEIKKAPHFRGAGPGQWVSWVSKPGSFLDGLGSSANEPTQRILGVDQDASHGKRQKLVYQFRGVRPGLLRGT